MFYQTFLSAQVKRCAIITCKHGIYEFPNKVPNDFRLMCAVFLSKSFCFDPRKKSLEKEKLKSKKQYKKTKNPSGHTI